MKQATDGDRSRRDPKQRFSDRVETYIRYRPSYPQQVLAALRAACGLQPVSVIADIGSGPGNLARLFLGNGNQVYGVEPNPEMREAGERLLVDYPNFTSVAGSAEDTNLPTASVDFITAGQAFHWFDLDPAQREFRRILRPRGWVVLVWNERQVDTTPFLRDYEQLLLDYGTDYETTQHRRFDAAIIEGFFGDARVNLKVFPNQQVFDYPSLEGRLLSSSYTPQAGHPGYAPILERLRQVFEAHQEHGVVRFIYDTKLYYGQFPSLD